MQEGKVFIDWVNCTLCQTCIAVCPTGALQLSKVEKTVGFSNLSSIDSIQPQTTFETTEKKSGIGIMVLSLVGQYVLPRMTDVLAAFLERKFSSTHQTHNISSDEPYLIYPRRRRRQRRSRMIS